MTTLSPPRPATQPRYRNLTGRSRAYGARPVRQAPRTPPDALKPRFSHAAAPPPRPVERAPRPSSAPFTEPAHEPAAAPATAAARTGGSDWLISPFRPPAPRRGWTFSAPSAPTQFEETF
ncbi:hypothetical protein ACWCQZ_40805 [Streptomyces sp. NPDC002285]